MELVLVDDYKQLSERAAELVAGIILRKPNAVLGLATGSTPVGTYKELIRKHREKGLNFSKIVTFNLDEYVGIPSSHPRSYHSYMEQQLFAHLDIPPGNIHIPNGDTENLKVECERYEQAIVEAGGIDLQLLGIGTNGHIGFNEPGSDPEGRTRVVCLAESTIMANSRFFASVHEVPRQAISIGIKTILSNSKHILLLANGEQKADAIEKMIAAEITSQVPASLLRLHPKVTVIVDRQAARRLPIEELPGRVTVMKN